MLFVALAAGVFGLLPRIGGLAHDAAELLIAVTVGFGAPRPTAVLAVLGYWLCNYWLPRLPGAVAYLHLRFRPKANSAALPAE